MNKIVIAVLILLLGAFSAHAASLKIGTLNYHKALNDSEDGVKASKVLEDMIAAEKSVFLEKENKIKALDEELKKQASILTPEKLKEKENELNKLYKEYQRQGKDFQEELQKKESELRALIHKDILEIVKEYGEKEGYSYIFEEGTSGILYSQDKFDITDKVIRILNKKSKSK